MLQRVGFVAVVRVHETYHRAPTGLDQDEESRLATGAVARLRARGYRVECDEEFDTDARPPSFPTLGSRVAHLAERIREATTTREVADALTELTATGDGILTALHEVLSATADFHGGLGQPADPHIARRLRYLAEEHLHLLASDLAHTRNALADRNATHPGRSACSGEVPAAERERSAVCACPRPPRTLPAPPPPVTAAVRR
ncbi:hypothetical protein [Streptomyces sp. NPDC056405]|uniref:hypothetical protein n=1 Tax=Streptomyces sp. NPDC056405 TaxID=3345811 RepID=UPI0035E20870